MCGHLKDGGFWAKQLLKIGLKGIEINMPGHTKLPCVADTTKREKGGIMKFFFSVCVELDLFFFCCGGTPSA